MKLSLPRLVFSALFCFGLSTASPAASNTPVNNGILTGISSFSGTITDSALDWLTPAGTISGSGTINATSMTLIGFPFGPSSGFPAFATVSVSGQQPVLATASNSTLTLVAGGGIGLTTNSASGALTITSLAGGGTVTQVTSGNLSPLFTVAVTNTTSTPSFAFTSVSESPNLVYASPSVSGGIPLFRGLVAADIPGLSGQYLSLSGGTVTGSTVFSGATTSITGLILAGTELINPAMLETDINGNPSITANFGNYNTTSNSRGLALSGGVLGIGTTNSDSGAVFGAGWAGAITIGGLRANGPVYSQGGVTQGIQMPTQFWNKMYAMRTTSIATSLNFWITGDSVATKMTSSLLPNLQLAYGFAGLSQPGFGLATGGAGTATQSYTLSGTGVVDYTTSVGDTLTYPNVGATYWSSPYFVGTGFVLPVIDQSGNGTVKIQTSTAAAPYTSFSSFADAATGITASTSSVTATVVTVSVSATPVGIKARIVSTAGGVNQFTQPTFINSASSGIVNFLMNQGGIALNQFNTVNPRILAALIAAFPPDIITVQYRDGNQSFSSDLVNLANLFVANSATTSTTALPTAFGLGAPLVFLGLPPSSNSVSSTFPFYALNNNPTTASGVENGILSAFATNNGYIFWQGPNYEATEATIARFYNAQWQGDGTHVAPQDDTSRAGQFASDMHLFNNVYGVSPSNFSASYGSLQESLTFNSLAGQGATNMQWTGGALGENHDQNYSTGAQNFTITYNTLLNLTDWTSGTVRANLTAAGQFSLGVGGSGYDFTAGANSGGTRRIRFDQSGSIVGDALPAILLQDANNDTLGGVLSRNFAANTLLTSYNSGAATGILSLGVANASGTASYPLTISTSLITASLTLSAQTLSATATTLSGAVTMSGLASSATGYHVTVNTTSGAIAYLVDSGGSGTVTQTTATFNSGLIGSVTNTTSTPNINIASPIFLGETGTASPALNTASLSMAFGSILTVPATGTAALLGANQQFTGTVSFSGPSVTFASPVTIFPSSGVALTVDGAASMSSFTISGNSSNIYTSGTNVLNFGTAFDYVELGAGDSKLHLAGSSNGVTIDSGPFTSNAGLNTLGSTSATIETVSGTLNSTGTTSLSATTVSALLVTVTHSAAALPAATSTNSAGNTLSLSVGTGTGTGAHGLIDLLTAVNAASGSNSQTVTTGFQFDTGTVTLAAVNTTIAVLADPTNTTTNTAPLTLTLTPNLGTGNAGGKAFVINVPVLAASGSTSQTLTQAVTISNSGIAFANIGTVTFAGPVNTGANTAASYTTSGTVSATNASVSSLIYGGAFTSNGDIVVLNSSRVELVGGGTVTTSGPFVGGSLTVSGSINGATLTTSGDMGVASATFSGSTINVNNIPSSLGVNMLQQDGSGNIVQQPLVSDPRLKDITGPLPYGLFDLVGAWWDGGTIEFHFKPTTQYDPKPLHGGVNARVLKDHADLSANESGPDKILVPDQNTINGWLIKSVAQLAVLTVLGFSAMLFAIWKTRRK